MEKVDLAIIGAGIVGLAVSASATKKGRTVYVLEKSISFGQETSSRNSEVIHAGIYYPKNSLKAKTCLDGNRLIYEICEKEDILCKRTGKLIVAYEKSEVEKLRHLFRNGQENGVSGLKILSKKELKNIEPNVKAEAALFSPKTGIVDTHNLMRYFFLKAKSQGAEFAFQTEVTQIAPQENGLKVTVRDSDGTDFSFFSRIIINCAGLNSEIIAQFCGIDTKKAGYTLKFCKGEYFRVGNNKSRLIKHLIYPLPDPKGISLGIHATPDLGGGLRLGPDAQYLDRGKVNYDVDETRKKYFFQAVGRFLPFITIEDLTADIAGIRPKLQGEKNGFRDFIICHEESLPGLINLIGIDSPGLTSAPAIAIYVEKIIEKLL